MATPSSVEFPVTLSPDGTWLQIPERLSVLEAVAFKAACQKLCNEEPLPQAIILDFDRTRFMDSSGVGALVGSYKLAHSQEIPFRLRAVHPPVMAVLALTGLNDVLEVEIAAEPLPDHLEARSRHREDDYPTTHPSVRSWLKRFIDIAGALVGLAITGVLLVPIAIAIWIDNPGPILFCQTRCGWMGKRFRLWKFRSMVANAESLRHTVQNQASGAFFKNDNDPRITRVGRFLRRTSLDELPQFWNVLEGNMSLVGTRPPTPDEVERYEVPQWQRLDVRPGMTGEWQVNGRSQVKQFEDVIRLDLKYQENWSLMYDIKLILKTILVLFNKNSGAM